MAAYQALLSLGFSRQEHWSGLPFPSPVRESEQWKWSCSVMSDFAIPWTTAHQVPPSMGFSKQEYWSGVPLPSPYFAILSFSKPNRRPRTFAKAPASKRHMQEILVKTCISMFSLIDMELLRIFLMWMFCNSCDYFLLWEFKLYLVYFVINSVLVHKFFLI